MFVKHKDAVDADPDLRMELQMRYGGVACYCVKKKMSSAKAAGGGRSSTSQRTCHSVGALKITAVPEEGERDMEGGSS